MLGFLDMIALIVTHPGIVVINERWKVQFYFDGDDFFYRPEHETRWQPVKLDCSLFYPNLKWRLNGYVHVTK